MRRLAMTLAAPAALLALLALCSSAFAESAWWHLSSGPRPAYLKAGGGAPAQDELQEIVLNLEGGQGAVSLSVGSSELGFFATEPTAAEFGVPVADAASIQAALEGPYGAGKVTVTEHLEGEKLTFKVTSPPGTPIAVENAGFGTPEVKVVSAGRAATPDGELYVTAENLGNENIEGKASKVVLKDVLPKGLHAVAVSGSEPFPQGDFAKRVAIPCTLEETGEVQTATCTMKETLAPYDQLEMRIGVNVTGAEGSEQLNQATITGGGAQAASIQRKVPISSAPVPFGVENYELALEEEGGAATEQAGAHPFQLTTTIDFNQLKDIRPIESETPEVTTPALTKDVNVQLPPGLIGNATSIPQCTTAEFFQAVAARENLCPEDTTVGVAVVTVQEPASVGTATIVEPISNLEPRRGEPARFGFNVVIANTPVFIDTSVATGSDYAVTAKVSNVTQLSSFLSAETTFWGVPGDARHDKQRGWGCIYEARGAPGVGGQQTCQPARQEHPAPFLSMPTRCDTPLQSSMSYDSWQQPGVFQQAKGLVQPLQALSGCNRLQFLPEIQVKPDGQEAARPSGLNLDVHVPQQVDENAGGPVSSNIRDISVAFPQGVTVNPSAAGGLQACAEGQVGFLNAQGSQGELLFTPTLPEAFCPDASKIGTVKIHSPLLPPGQSVTGSLYLATPAPNHEAGQNPFDSLLAMYIIAEDPVSGVLVKLPGTASLDPSSGQITSTFANNPQLDFEDAEIHLFGGERAPLAMPVRCATYTTEASFTPWSGTAPVKSSSSFAITSGPHGTPCPSTPLPFAPSLNAGSTNINAGAFGPLSTTVNREETNQALQSVQLHMPPGLSGILTGVTLCPEAQANAASCPQSSLIGHTTVSVGLGSEPFTTPTGQVFLTESYKGAPFGLAILAPAIAGPFDLGNVLVRAKVEVDPHTAALTVTTDESGPYAIPRILDGIPLQIRHANVTIDRPGFTFNPTSCNPQAITGTITSYEGARAPVSSPLQMANCANLKFAPKFAVSTSSKSSKANGTSLNVKLSYPSAPLGTYANLAKVKVSLPKQLPSRLTTLQKACTAAVFDANPANCPKESIVGQAKVLTPVLPVPLSGSAYFVSHGGEAFPDLTIVLKGYGITVDLVGSTQIKNGITTSTFKATPDVPFSSFELNLPAQKFSALTANANLCKSKLVMPSEFQAQNGQVIHQNTPISVTGCPKALTSKQKLAKALKACHKKHSHSRRAACERQARKRFGALKAKKHKKH
jgi:hypothetical protein